MAPGAGLRPGNGRDRHPSVLTVGQPPLDHVFRRQVPPIECNINITVALDLFSPLKVVSWASAHADCPMRYKINNPTDVVIVFGSGTNEFEFSFDTGALRALMQLGSEALEKMDTSAEDRLGELVTTAERRA